MSLYAQAAKHEAGNREVAQRGREAGLDAKPTIAILSPEGLETRFKVEREASVKHRVTLVKQETQA